MYLLNTNHISCWNQFNLDVVVLNSILCNVMEATGLCPLLLTDVVITIIINLF